MAMCDMCYKTQKTYSEMSHYHMSAAAFSFYCTAGLDKLSRN